jgi:hypothetical protein
MISPEGQKDLEAAQRQLYSAKQSLIDKIAFHLGKLGPEELMEAVERLIQPKGVDVHVECTEKRPKPFIRALQRVVGDQEMTIDVILGALKIRSWLPKGSKDPRGYVTAYLCDGVKKGLFVRVREGTYKLAADATVNFAPHKKVKVTTAIVWATIPKIVGEKGNGRHGGGEFRTSGIIKVLGCKGEQLATPLANLRRWGHIERATGRWYKVTDFGVSRFGTAPGPVKAR